MMRAGWNQCLVVLLAAAAWQSPAACLADESALAGEATSASSDPTAETGQPASADDEPSGPPRPFSSPRELLDLLGVRDSHFRSLMDGRSVDGNEQEAILRVLYAMRRLPAAEAEEWAHGAFNPAGFADDPRAPRGELFRISGHVTRVDREHPVPEVVERFEMPHYYRCRLELAEGGGMATLFAVTVPKKWPIGADMRERASALGLFLKWDAVDPLPAGPVFACERVAWHPATVLGDLEMDVGLFDDVENRTQITSRDRECFYQLLAAAGRAGANELDRRTMRPEGQDYSVVPLFNAPHTQHGELAAFTGTARRALEVLVSDADVRERFGIDRYYQIEIITEDSQNNPLVFCVRELPPGMPSGPNILEPVRIPGFFFKTWAYSLPQLDPDEKPRRQLAPMLIGKAPMWLRTESRQNPYARGIAAGLFVAAMMGVWLAVWRLSRGDRKFQRQVIGKKFEPPPGESLNDLDLEVDPGPDFRGNG